MVLFYYFTFLGHFNAWRKISNPLSDSVYSSEKVLAAFDELSNM